MQRLSWALSFAEFAEADPAVDPLSWHSSLHLGEAILLLRRAVEGARLPPDLRHDVDEFLRGPTDLEVP